MSRCIAKKRENRKERQGKKEKNTNGKTKIDKE